MRRDKEDGVPVPVLRWQSEQQRGVWANQPSRRVRQPVLCKERQSQRRNAKTYAHMPAVPSSRVVSQRVGANPRAAQHTSGTPVHTEELAERGNERSIGYRTCCWAAKGAGKGLRPAYCLTLLSETRRKSPAKRPAGGQRTCCWAAKGAGKGLRAASGAGKGLRPAYCQEGFKGSLGRREAFKASRAA